MCRGKVRSIAYAWVLVASACIGDSPGTPSADGGLADSAPSDGSTADAQADVVAGDASAARCDPKKPFGAPTLLAGVNDPKYDDFRFRVTADGLYGLLQTTRPTADGGATTGYLWSFSRSTVNDAFSNATPLDLPASFDGTLSGDGLRVYYTRASGGYDVWQGSRGSLSVGFSLVGPFPVGSSPTINETAPSVLPDESQIFFGADTGTGSTYHVFFSNRENGVYASPVRVESIVTAAGEGNPVPAAEGNVLYYSTNRPDGGSKGGADIWRAERPSKGAPFGVPVNAAELNTPADDNSAWASQDDCEIYIFSNRAGSGGYDVYSARRPR